MKLSPNIFLLSSFLIFLGGCSVLNLNFFSSKKPTAASLEKFQPKIDLVEKWEIKIGSNNVLNSGIGSYTPSIDENKVITTIGSGYVSAFDLSEGTQIWKVKIGNKILCSAGYKKIVDTEFIAAITEMGELVLINSSNEILWKSKLNGIVRVQPVITNTVVIALYADNRIVAFDLNSGKRIWALKRGVPSLILHGQSGMTLISDLENSKNLSSDFENGLLVNMAGGRLIFLDAMTGTVNWESRIAFSRGTNEVERISDLMGNPHVDNEVCTTAYQNSLVCLSMLNGKVIWRTPFNSVQPASFSESIAIAIDSNSKIRAYNRMGQKSLQWKSDKFFLRKISAPVIWNTAVWFVDKKGYLHGLSLNDGEVVSRYRLKDGILSGMIKTTDEGILIQTASGQLILLAET